MSGYRPAYTLKEERLILAYILQKKASPFLRGNLFWKELENAQVVDRTWQSLKEHFRKKIINQLHLPHYNLSEEERERIRYNYQQTSAGNKLKYDSPFVVESQKNQTTQSRTLNQNETPAGPSNIEEESIDEETTKRYLNLHTYVSSDSSSSDSPPRQTNRQIPAVIQISSDSSETP